MRFHEFFKAIFSWFTSFPFPVFMHFTFKTRQSVADTSMTTQFHECFECNFWRVFAICPEFVTLGPPTLFGVQFFMKSHQLPVHNCTGRHFSQLFLTASSTLAVLSNIFRCLFSKYRKLSNIVNSHVCTWIRQNGIFMFVEITVMDSLWSFSCIYPVFWINPLEVISLSFFFFDKNDRQNLYS